MTEDKREFLRRQWKTVSAANALGDQKLEQVIESVARLGEAEFWARVEFIIDELRGVVSGRPLNLGPCDLAILADCFCVGAGRIGEVGCERILLEIEDEEPDDA